MEREIVALAQDEEGIQASFAPDRLLGRREAALLTQQLGVGSYAQTMATLLWLAVVDPRAVDQPPLRSNSPIWNLLGLRQEEVATPEQGADALLRFLRILAGLEGEEKQQCLIEYGVARLLRGAFGLSRGRTVSTFSERAAEHQLQATQRGMGIAAKQWDPEDARSARGFEEVEWRQLLEAVREPSPPAQQAALDAYLEARRSGRTVHDVSRALGYDPATVRNNLAALKRKLAKRKLPE